MQAKTARSNTVSGELLNPLGVYSEGSVKVRNLEDGSKEFE